MSTYDITRRADRDLDAIWEIVNRTNGSRVANRIEQELHDAMQLISEHPKIGHFRSDVKNPRYRFWSVYKFVIAYRTDKSPVCIARVVHGARDFRRLFR